METGNPAIANVRRKFYMLPLAVRLSVTMSIGTYLCSWFTPLNRFIAMCPQLFLFRLQVWTVFTSPFACSRLLNLLLGGFFFSQLGAQFERSMGTVFFSYTLLLISALANLLYFAFSVFTGEALSVSPLGMMGMSCSQGLFMPLLAFISIQCFRSDRPTMPLFGITQVPTRAYPFVLLLFFALLGGSILDNLAFVLVGIAYAKGHLDRFALSDQKAAAFENSPSMQWATGALGFVSHVSGVLAFGDQVLGQQQESQEQGSSQSSFATPFSGGGQQSSSNHGSSNNQQPERPTFPGQGHRLG